MDANNQSLSTRSFIGIAIGANETFPFKSSATKVEDHPDRQVSDPEVVEHLTSFVIGNSIDHLGVYDDLSKDD
jgi:hypothetical protein